MVHKEILEGNKIIGTFMRPEEFDGTSDCYFVIVDVYTADELIYHRSWKWLMPVVHKCFESTTEDERSFAGLALFELGLFTPIDEIWQAVISFIKWHNENNKVNN